MNILPYVVVDNSICCDMYLVSEVTSSNLTCAVEAHSLTKRMLQWLP